ncbi:MAG: AsmA-like C-terminal region-containing protein [Janthinobacterium lividum]
MHDSSHDGSAPDGLPPDDGSSAACGRHLLRRPPRRRTGLRRAALALTGFVASLGFIVALLATGMFVKLRQGPITFDLRPQIIAALGSRIGHGYRVDMASTAIEATDHGPALTIHSLSMRDASSRPVVSAPTAAIAVDPLALLVGKISPTRLDINDVDLRLVIRPDGQVAISAGSDEAAVPLAAAFDESPDSGTAVAPPSMAVDTAADGTAAIPPKPGNAALRALSAAMKTLVDTATAPDSAFNALERVNVTGRLLLDDRIHNTTTVFNNTALSFTRGPSGAPTLSVAADAPNGRWSLEAHASAQPDGGKLLTVDAANLSLDEITLAGGLKSLGFDFDLPVSANLAIKLAADGQIDSAKGTFSLGSGYFKLDDPDHEPLLINGVNGGFHLDRTTNGVEIDRTELHGPTSDFAVTGHVDLPHSLADPWSGRLGLSGAFLPERPGEKPIRLNRGDVVFHVQPAEHRLLIDKAELSGPEVDYKGTVEILYGPAGVHIRNTSSVRHMPAQTLVRLWPSFVSAPVRAWLLTNLKGGMVENGTATSNLDANDLALMRAERSVADDHVHVDFNVSNLGLAFMSGVPPLTDVAGNGVVTGRTFTLQVQRGSLDVSPGHRLTLADGSLRVPDNDPKPTPAIVDARIQGGVEVMAELLSRDALKSYADLPMDAGAMHGQVDGRLTVGFLMGDNVPPNSATVSVNATASNFGLDKLVGKEGLSDATIKLDVDPKNGTHAKGEGRLYGAATSVELHKPVSGQGEALIALTLDDAARVRAGMASPSLKGPVAAKITAPLTSGDKTRASVDLDFTKAGIDGIVPGFSKPSGRPAKATLNVIQRDNGVTLDNIAFDGGGAVVRGTVDLDKDGDFASAKLSQVKLSPGDDMHVEAQQSGDTLKVTTRGANLDGRPFLKWLSAPSTAGASPDVSGKSALDLDLRSTILTGQNSQAITGAELHVTRRGGQVKRMTLAGRIGRQPLTIQTAQIDGAPHFLIHSGDAGASLLFMDLYKRMAGGLLDANLVNLAQRLDGTVTVHDFTLREDPAIRKLAVEGLASQKHDDTTGSADAPNFDPSAMSFRKLEASFSKTGNMVQVRDGSMFGPALGATVAGTIDFSRDQVNLTGTFVPLFGVNNLFSQLPVLGPILGGGSHEGLLGLNYRITGSAANPQLSVNPLSALAPGFLRQIFGALDGAASGGGAGAPGVGSLPLGQD